MRPTQTFLECRKGKKAKTSYNNEKIASRIRHDVL